MRLPRIGFFWNAACWADLNVETGTFALVNTKSEDDFHVVVNFWEDSGVCYCQQKKVCAFSIKRLRPFSIALMLPKGDILEQPKESAPIELGRIDQHTKTLYVTVDNRILEMPLPFDKAKEEV